MHVLSLSFAHYQQIYTNFNHLLSEYFPVVIGNFNFQKYERCQIKLNNILNHFKLMEEFLSDSK